MDRQLLGYLLIALVAVALIGIGFYIRHHGPERSYQRSRARDRAWREAKGRGPADSA